MRVLLLLLVAALIAGCAVSPLPGRPGAETVPAPPTTLASEQRRLRKALDGTPVIVETTDDGSMRVEVPLEFSFDAGRGAVKKPLAAVLDRMAVGLRSSPFEIRVAAPADAKRNNNLLVKDRAASVRDYLVARGVAAQRFAALGRASGEFVELLVAERVKPTASR